MSSPERIDADLICEARRWKQTSAGPGCWRRPGSEWAEKTPDYENDVAEAMAAIEELSTILREQCAYVTASTGPKPQWGKLETWRAYVAVEGGRTSVTYRHDQLHVAVLLAIQNYLMARKD